MMEWLLANIGTILITLLLILTVAAVVRSLIRDKKRGRSICGGNCAHCKMCAACHRARADAKHKTV